MIRRKIKFKKNLLALHGGFFIDDLIKVIVMRPPAEARACVSAGRLLKNLNAIHLRNDPTC